MFEPQTADHFDELKRELDGFNGLFTAWRDQRCRALTSDREAYQRTLAEEQETVEALKKQAAQLAQKKQALAQGKTMNFSLNSAERRGTRAGRGSQSQ